MKQLKLYYPLQASYQGSRKKFKKYQSRLQYHKYLGEGFTCNFCGASYQKFIPDFPSAENKGALIKHEVIAGYGENCICPQCQSTARERLVKMMLEEHIDWMGKKILHLAPEEKIYRFLKNHAKVTTADLEPGFYQSMDKQCMEENLIKLSYANNSFDLVIANHVLEHVEADHQAMKEIFRVLQPEGQAILQVPFSDLIDTSIESNQPFSAAQRSALFGQKDHVRIYAGKDYINRLTAAGFEVRRISHPASLTGTSYALQKEECFFWIKKRNKA